ncbi:MAG: hypothetical protein ICV61_01370 [Microcoleus sp. Co-bin12]|nr:hypothetical protein [Microcoleus sp. Co-bin12]
MVNLSSLFTIYCSDWGASHTFSSLGEQWNYADSQVRMVVPNCAPSCRRPNLVEAVSRYLKWLYYRSADWPRDFTEKRFLRDIKDFDAIYLWPNTSIETFRKVKQQSKPIFGRASTAIQSRQNLLLMMLPAAWESLPTQNYC